MKTMTHDLAIDMVAASIGQTTGRQPWIPECWQYLTGPFPRLRGTGTGAGSSASTMGRSIPVGLSVSHHRDSTIRRLSRATGSVSFPPWGTEPVDPFFERRTSLNI